MELIKCNDCIYKTNCPCGYSYCNAACLTIQKKKLSQQSKRENNQMINTESMTTDDIENLAEEFCNRCCSSCDECGLDYFVRTLNNQIEEYNKKHFS